MYYKIYFLFVNYIIQSGKPGLQAGLCPAGSIACGERQTLKVTAGEYEWRIKRF
jgi:hypothetical protein